LRVAPLARALFLSIFLIYIAKVIVEIIAIVVDVVFIVVDTTKNFQQGRRLHSLRRRFGF